MDAIEELLARDRIRDRLARLAHGEDRRDAETIAACYWPDATTDYGIFRGDLAATISWIVPGAEAVRHTQHVLGQSLIERAGAEARVETHVLAYHRVEGGDGARDVAIGGRYLDLFARRGDAWRIATRTMLYDWVQDWGAATDWRHGLMGTPFSACHYPGRTQGDHGAAFLAGGRA